MKHSYCGESDGRWASASRIVAVTRRVLLSRRTRGGNAQAVFWGPPLLAAADYLAVRNDTRRVGMVAALAACTLVSACGGDVTSTDGGRDPVPEARVVEIRRPTRGARVG